LSVAGGIATFLLAVLLIPSPGVAGFTNGNAVSTSAHPGDAATGSVAFNVNILPLSSLSVGLQLNAAASLSGGSITPGQTATADASLTLPTTIDLSITYHGVSTSVAIPGIGTSYDVPVPGLGLTYLGYGLGVFLNFSGVISGNSTVSGAGHGGGGLLTWTSSGTKVFPLTAETSASAGSSVTSTLSSLTYGISMGLDAGARIPIIGNYVVHILNFGRIGLFPGSPSSIQSTYVVPSPPSLGLSALTGGGPLNGPTLILVFAAAVAAVAVLLIRRRNTSRRRGAPESPAPRAPSR
jgi:hypothetical protein